MRTFPFGNNVAVWNLLATAMLPVGTKTPCSTVVPVVPAELVVPPVVPVVPAELVVPPVVPVVPPRELVPPPAAPVVLPPLLPPPVEPLVTPPVAVVAPPTCCSPIGVRKQASPINENAKTIADHAET